MSSLSDVIGTLAAFAALCVPTAYIAYQIRVLRRWAGLSRLAAAIPLPLWTLWAILLLVARMDDPTFHSLWPFEILIGACLSGLYLLLLAQLRQWRRDRAMTRGKLTIRRYHDARLLDEPTRHARLHPTIGGSQADGPI
jgi:hypothetical protein